MKEQIDQTEELARDIYDSALVSEAVSLSLAIDLTEKGWRKQSEVAREIFAELWEMVIPEKCTDGCAYYLDMAELAELEKKYTEYHHDDH